MRDVDGVVVKTSKRSFIPALQIPQGFQCVRHDIPLLINNTAFNIKKLQRTVYEDLLVMPKLFF